MRAFFEIKEVKGKGYKVKSIVPIPYVEWNSYNDVVTLQFQPQIMPYLIELKKNFTKYALSDVMRLNSKYSIILYKWLCMFYNQYEHYSVKGGRRAEQVEAYRNPSIKISELRSLTDTINEYKDMSNFTKRVLDNSLKEINDHTSFNVTYDKIKKGRSIDRIVFHIEKKRMADDNSYKLEDKAYKADKKQKEEKELLLSAKAMQIRTITLNVKQMRILFGDEDISDGTIRIMIGEKDKEELSITGHYYDGDSKRKNLLSTLIKVGGSVTESTSHDSSIEASEKTESSSSRTEDVQMPRDPAELAGTGTPKGYNEFNNEQQKAIGKAVDAVTNNLGVDRTIYNYTVESDVLSGSIYVGRFDDNELMDVIVLDDKLLDYKGILDSSSFAQLNNQTLEQFISGYTVASSTCSLAEKDGRVVIYFIMDEKNRSNGDAQKIQQYIELTRRVSNDVKNNVKTGVAVSLQEPFESDYSVTFVDGQPNSATKAYQSVIDKMSF